MAALALCIGLFLYWHLLGLALVSVLHSRRNVLQSWLLAPAVGAAAVVLCVYWLNRFGVPVGRFGPALAMALFLAAGAVLLRTRPVVPVRRLCPFGVVLLFALLLIGRPMLQFGFDWVSYGNDDMTNYVMGATRALHHGFTDPPDREALLLNRDVSLNFWFMHAVAGIRAGADLTLAWVMSCTGLNGLQAFMPVIVALHLVLVGVSGALVFTGRRRRFAAWLACLWVSCSALTVLGTLYQLIGQVFGMVLLVGAAALLFRTRFACSPAALFRESVLTGLVLSALILVYPEMLPFLALAFGLWLVICLARRRLDLARGLRSWCWTGFTAALVVNRPGVIAIDFLRQQAGVGLEHVDVADSLFPFYLIPSGLANLWGFLPIDEMSLPEPWLSAAILAGGATLLAATLAVAWRAAHAEPVSALGLVFLGMGFYFFAQRLDFATFKLAMYLQPFLIGSIVVAWAGYVPGPRRTRRLPRLAAVAPVILFSLAGLPVIDHYVDRSRGLPGGLVEVPYASSSRMISALLHASAQLPQSYVIADTLNVVISKFHGICLPGRVLSWPANDYMGLVSSAFTIRALDRFQTAWIKSLPQEMLVRARRLLRERRDDIVPRTFDLQQDSPRVFQFYQSVGLIPPGCDPNSVAVIRDGPAQTVLNRRSFPPGARDNFLIAPLSTVSNHLIFINSDLGQGYYQGIRSLVSLFQVEYDPMIPGSSMAGAGRYMLLEVLNPASSTRLALELTSTLKGDAANLLPPAQVVGKTRVPLPLASRGSARVFSPPVVPQKIGGRYYLAIDMGVGGTPFPQRRTGLMRLYGLDLRLDNRTLVAFARDISLLSDEQYRSLRAPARVAVFPRDLTDQDLEYAGIYEDGWVSEQAYFQLSQPPGRSLLTVRGVVPKIDDRDFSCEARVLVDGMELLKQTLRPGDFQLQAVVPFRSGRRRVDLRFSGFQRLPAPDNRPAVGRLALAGF